MTAGHVLAYLPSPPQGVWNLGPLPIRAYALCIIIGIVVAVWWSDRRWQDRGGRPGDVLDVALIAVPFGLIGGRIYHVITDWWRYFGDGGKGVGAVFQIWDGGLGIWGAVAFGALGGWVGCRWKRIKLPAFGDAIAPAILLAQAIGRLGNYFNQELYGDPTTVPWGLELFERVDPDTGRRGVAVINGVSNGNVLEVVHPTFLYELVWNLLIVALLVFVDRRFRIGHGRLFALYVAGYCVGRFGIELMRSDEATHVLGLRVNVLVAALVFLGAALYVLMAPRGRETGLSMFWPDRAEELAAEGHLGYVPPALDGDPAFDDEDDDSQFAVVDDSADDTVDPDAEWEPESADENDVFYDTAVDDDVDTDGRTDDDATDDEAAGIVDTADEADESVASESLDDEPENAVEEETEDAAGSGASEGDVETPGGSEPAEAVTDEPVTDEPVTDEPAIEDAAIEEPVTEEPVTEEPVTEDAAIEESGSADSETADAETADAETADAETADAETADAETADTDAAESESSDAEREPGPGYTIVSSEDGLDLEGISVVEHSSGHDAGAIEIRPAEPGRADDPDA